MAVQTNVWQALILYEYGSLMTSNPVNWWYSSAKTVASLGIALQVKNKNSNQPFCFPDVKWHLLLCSLMQLQWCSIGTQKCHPLRLNYYVLHCIAWHGDALHSVVLHFTLLLLLLFFGHCQLVFFCHQLIVSFYVLLGLCPLLHGLVVALHCCMVCALHCCVASLCCIVLWWVMLCLVLLCFFVLRCYVIALCCSIAL